MEAEIGNRRGERTDRVAIYPFNSTHISKLHETYIRDTPQNGPSDPSHSENSNDSSNSHVTDEKNVTCHNLSHMAHPDNAGRVETCQTKITCHTEAIESMDNSLVGQVGQAKSGGMSQEKIIDFPDAHTNSSGDISETIDCERGDSSVPEGTLAKEKVYPVSNGNNSERTKGTEGTENQRVYAGTDAHTNSEEGDFDEGVL